MSLDHLYGWLDDHTAGIGKPDLGPGTCGECQHEVRVRWSFGLFVLCRDCRLRRASAAKRLADEAVGQSAVTGSAGSHDGEDRVPQRGRPVPPRRELIVVEDDLADDLLQAVDSTNGYEPPSGLDTDY